MYMIEAKTAQTFSEWDPKGRFNGIFIQSASQISNIG